MRCKHPHNRRRLLNRTNGWIWWEQEWCKQCKEWLSLGPANDDDPNVAIEVRAAEIAARVADWQVTHAADDALALTAIGGPKTDASRLAREIVEHDDPGFAKLHAAIEAFATHPYSEAAYPTDYSIPHIKTMNLNSLFACAMVEGCSLTDAAKKIDAPQSLLFDAVAYRMSVAVDSDIRDYHESIYACFKRLEAAN